VTAGDAGPARIAPAGTGVLTRLAFRRDRFALPAVVYVIVVAVTGTAYTFKRLYPTAAGRAALAATGESNAALRFLYGRLDGSSIGSLTTWRYGIWAGIFAALMAIFVVIRHTRTDEEAGRLELVGSLAVGRNAALVAALLTAVAVNVTAALLLCITLPLVGLPAAGSAALALGIGACGLAFAGIAAVAGLGYGLSTGSVGTQVTRMLGAGMAQLPASLAVAAVAVLPFGLLPGACVAGSWTVVGLVVAIELFGRALQVPQWVLDISPFTHVPRLPGGTVTAPPLVWTCLAGLALVAVGLGGFRRRDIG
jgi:putative exporter of polyketide antibiotics